MGDRLGALGSSVQCPVQNCAGGWNGSSAEVAAEKMSDGKVALCRL